MRWTLQEALPIQGLCWAPRKRFEMHLGATSDCTSEVARGAYHMTAVESTSLEGGKAGGVGRILTMVRYPVLHANNENTTEPLTRAKCATVRFGMDPWRSIGTATS